jgi:hypothetical protein
MASDETPQRPGRSLPPTVREKRNHRSAGQLGSANGVSRASVLRREFATYAAA